MSNSKINNSIYCDGGMNKFTKDVALGCVVDSENNCLISKYIDSKLFIDLELYECKLPVGTRKTVVSKFSDVSKMQNNGAELLALLISLRICNKYPEYKIIYCDSDLLIKYWSLGLINQKTRNKMDPLKLQYINECTQLRKIFESNNGKIIKISGSQNLADLGYHK